MAREINSCLSGGIAGSDQRHLLPAAKPCFQRRCPIVHAGALECFQTIDGEPPVSRAGGDHDRTCLCPLAIGKLQYERPALRTVQSIESRHLIGYPHLDPEFLRLIVRAGHQSHAADARWKTQIVLDASGCSGLAAECTAVEDEYRESFRTCIDGSSETGGPRAPPAGAEQSGGGWWCPPSAERREAPG